MCVLQRKVLALARFPLRMRNIQLPEEVNSRGSFREKYGLGYYIFGRQRRFLGRIWVKLLYMWSMGPFFGKYGSSYYIFDQ